jgi:hypothetical protein
MALVETRGGEPRSGIRDRASAVVRATRIIQREGRREA